MKNLIKSMRRNFLNSWTGWYRFSSYKKSLVELKSVENQTFTKKSKKLNDLLLNMPKDNKHVIEAQKQRIKIKAKSTKYPPGIINIQILGNGSKGSPAVVYLFSDQSRYLINCGEGCQRLAHEHKLKLARLENIFLTRTTWDKTGGMPGLCLTVQEAGVPNLTMYGPPGIQEIFDATRRFVVLKDLKVNVPECNDSDCYEDNVMTMHFVHLYRDPVDSGASGANAEEVHVQKELLKDSTDYYSYEGKSAKNSENPESGATWENNNDEERRQEEYVLSYICKLKPRPGQLDLAKCVERGVKPGPMLGQLKNGLDVTLDDGTVVRAEDVCGPSDPGPVCIFVDIPNENFLNSLKTTTRFNDYQKTAQVDSDSAMCVIHFSPKAIVEHPIYQQFMEKFSLSTKHFMLNEQNDFSGYVATHRIQWQLNQLDNQVFPVLKEANDISCDEDIEESLAKKIKMDEGIENQKLNVQDADKVGPLTAFHLRPKKGLDLSIVPEVNPKAFIDETTELEGFREVLDETLQQKRDLLVDRSNRSNDYPKIVFLGTGSCIPNKTRNVSSILVHVNKNNSIIFDCGEGTYGQIYRFYGKHQVDNVLKRVKAIFVSHLHADHHLGLIGLLKRRSLVTNEKIQLFAPHQIYSWLYFYDLHIERINHLYELVGNVELLNGPKKQQIKEIGLSNIQTCFVRHCPHAFAVSIEMNNNTISSIFKDEMVKITYSGDTIPCRNLVELGRNSTILIHEATMEDNMQEEAKFKMHSTISQAINQGKEMNAQYTILTHFSQRYAKIPRIENAVDQNVAIAFDNMEVTLNDLPLLHLFYPSLKVMFQEHCLEMEEKALKRQYKKERNPKPTVN